VAIWGAQLEEGPLTSYIPTTTAAVTRAADISSSAAATRVADVLTMTGTNFSDWYRQDEGTFVVSGNSNGASSKYPTLFAVSDSTVSNFLQLAYGSATLKWDGYSLGAQQFSLNLTKPTGVAVNYAGAYKIDDVGSSLDGVLVGTDFLASIPKLTALYVGSNYSGLSSLNGTISRIAYYPKRLSNTELQVITQ
jgi:hypothetical protein